MDKEAMRLLRETPSGRVYEISPLATVARLFRVVKIRKHDEPDLN